MQKSIQTEGFSYYKPIINKLFSDWGKWVEAAAVIYAVLGAHSIKLFLGCND